MRKPPVRKAWVAALALLGLAACSDDRGGMAASGGVCMPFPGQSKTGAAPPGVPQGPAAALDDCLHHWGYALAPSSDPAGDVAGAVVAACTTTLASWNQQGAADARGPAEAPSLITGESTNPVAERYGFARSRALFYVVQARAGKCPAPPMKDGVPTGY